MARRRLSCALTTCTTMWCLALPLPVWMSPLRALAHLQAKGVKLINGPLIHGIEGGGNLGGSGSRSFYFNDPDGNRLEIYTDMMRVPNGEEFPRKEYANVLQEYVPSGT